MKFSKKHSILTLVALLALGSQFGNSSIESSANAQADAVESVMVSEMNPAEYSEYSMTDAMSPQIFLSRFTSYHQLPETGRVSRHLYLIHPKNLDVAEAVNDRSPASSSSSDTLVNNREEQNVFEYLPWHI